MDGEEDESQEHGSSQQQFPEQNESINIEVHNNNNQQTLWYLTFFLMYTFISQILIAP